MRSSHPLAAIFELLLVGPPNLEKEAVDQKARSTAGIALLFGVVSWIMWFPIAANMLRDWAMEKPKPGPTVHDDYEAYYGKMLENINKDEKQEIKIDPKDDIQKRLVDLEELIRSVKEDVDGPAWGLDDHLANRISRLEKWVSNGHIKAKSVTVGMEDEKDRIKIYGSSIFHEKDQTITNRIPVEESTKTLVKPKVFQYFEGQEIIANP